MGRKKIEKLVLFATRRNEFMYQIETYKEIDNKFQSVRIDKMIYAGSDIEEIYRFVANLFEDDHVRIQLVLQLTDGVITNGKFLYRSCNSKTNKVYEVNVNPHEVDCTCDWSTMYVKTGIDTKLCHHVREVKTFLGL